MVVPVSVPTPGKVADESCMTAVSVGASVPVPTSVETSAVLYIKVPESVPTPESVPEMETALVVESAPKSVPTPESVEDESVTDANNVGVSVPTPASVAASAT